MITRCYYCMHPTDGHNEVKCLRPDCVCRKPQRCCRLAEVVMGTVVCPVHEEEALRQRWSKMQWEADNEAIDLMLKWADAVIGEEE